MTRVYVKLLLMAKLILMSAKRILAVLVVAILGLSPSVMMYAGNVSIQQPRFQKNPVFNGVVKDEKGETLPGVAVRTSDGKYHTSTDLDGNFTIQVTPGKDVSLYFYYLGMKDEKIDIFRKGQLVMRLDTKIIVAMKSDSQVLEGVVVTGYGNVSKKSFTGTVTSLSNKEIMRAAPSNAIAALQIFDPSLRIAENMLDGSNPNSIPQMSVRGQSGVGNLDISETGLKNNTNLPTFILDGFEVDVNKVINLDVNRIESMTLLKDAAATAMYGSRAANGVLVITTIPPAAGKVNVSYTLGLNLQTPDLSYYHLMDPLQKIETERRAGLYDSPVPDRKLELDRIYNEKLLNVERGIQTDWMRLPLRNSLSHKHSLYVDGGEGAIRYGIDLNYDRNAGVMKASFKEKFSAGLMLKYVYESLSVKNYVSFDNVRGQESPYGSYASIINMNPYDTYVDENGNVTKDMQKWFSETVYNPVYDSTLGSYDVNKHKQFRDNFEIMWNINDYLNIRANASVYYDLDNHEKFQDPDATIFLHKTDKGSLNLTDRNSWGYDANLLLYYNQLYKKHHFNLSAGFNIKESYYKNVSHHYVGFPNGGFTSPQFAEKLMSKPVTMTDNQRLLGTLLRFNYTYDNIYLLDISGRVDGSSQFGSKRKFAPFASGGLGLNIHNYDAVKRGAPWLTQLKIRASYGQTGNVKFRSYEAQDKFNIIVDKWFPTGSAATLNHLGNPNLKWETTDTFEYGGELSLFDQIFYIKANRYIKITKDMIVPMTLPSSSGFTVYKENVGQMSNKGWELNIRARLYNNKDLHWYVFTNLTQNKNKLLKISDALKAYNDKVNELASKDAYSNAVPQLKYFEGASMTALYGMKSLGVDPATGMELFKYKDGTVGNKWIASETTVICDTEPKVSGSFGTNFFWKGLTFDMYFRFEYGGQIYNRTLLDKIERADPNFNCDTRVLTDRWSAPGDVSAFKGINSWKTMTQPTSRFVQDYNWLKLASLSLGYDVPQKYLKKAKISRLKFQFNCSDVFTVSTVRMEKGTSYPFARGFNFIANITF